MILASAQIKTIREDINANLDKHYEMVALAAKKGADLLVFPELSLSGYEREKAKDLAFTEQDGRLNKLRRLSIEHDMVIIVGAPLILKAKMYIGSFILKPDNRISHYTKQFLHTGEEVYFDSSFDYNPVIDIKGERISLAICADINNPKHAENASKTRTTIYLASIFFEPEDMQKAYRQLSAYANQYSMHVLMSNFTGPCWDLEGGGKSAFWDDQGKIISTLGATDEDILLIVK